MEEEYTLEDYLTRIRVINKLQDTGEWANPKIRRLIYNIFGSEDDWEGFIENCSSEEIDTILIAEGFNLEELKAKLEKGIEEIKARFASQPYSSKS